MKEIASIKRKRICKLLHCNSILSIYNSGDYCYMHKRLGADKKSRPLSSTSIN